MENNTERAQALYGLGWTHLPELAREVAADFVPELLMLEGGPNWDDCAYDRARECADAGVPIYRSDLLALLADADTADRILQAADDLGGVDNKRGGDYLTALVSLGVYGMLSEVLNFMVRKLDYAEGWLGLGLDADAADVAATLLPEWSGTVAELLAAAPRLAVEGVTA